MSTVYFRIAARGPVTLARAPLLEQMLARADATSRVLDWRAEAFRVIAPQSGVIPAIAAAALHASAGSEAGTWGCIATPVHFVAGMSSVSMAGDGILDLHEAEADALAADFNRLFSGEGMRLARGRDRLLLCLFDAPLRVETAAPEEALGRDIWTFRPRGADAARLRRLMSEIEMWLFEHPVNEHRRACAVPAISGLWLWGGGAGGEPLPAVQGWTAGEDPLFAAFGPHAEYPGAASPGVVVITDWPGTPAWRPAEQRWLAPALSDLRSGRLRRLELSAGNRCFSVSTRGLWRFWRRMRPWWETFGVGEGTDDDQ